MRWLRAEGKKQIPFGDDNRKASATATAKASAAAKKKRQLRGCLSLRR
jgi:hypothetical protein